MREAEFYDFLENFNYAESTIDTKVKICRKLELYFSEDLKLNIDEVVTNDTYMEKALDIISNRYSNPSTFDQHANTLVLYYYFTNGVTYRGWDISRITRKGASSMITKDLANAYPGIIQFMEDFIVVSYPKMSSFKIPTLIISDAHPEHRTIGSLDEADIDKKLKEVREKYENKYPNHRNIIGALTGGEAKWNLMDKRENQDTNDDKPEWVDDLADEVKRIFAEEKYDFDVSGKYNYRSNTITIFSKVFEKITDPDEKNARIRMTIAHELFHAIHHHLTPNSYKENSYYADIVREALADAFSVILGIDTAHTRYATLDGISDKVYRNIVSNRHEFWRKYLFTYLPYPNAIFITDGPNPGYMWCIHDLDTCHKKFKAVLDTSINQNMYNAYLELVPEEFRKDPPEKSANLQIGGTAQVKDKGSVKKGNYKDSDWEILKKIIADKNIGSLQELQDFLSPDIFVVTRGRFITLESGEILSAYPQWKIVDNDKFREFVKDYYDKLDYEDFNWNDLFVDDEPEKQKSPKSEFNPFEYSES